MEITKKKLYRNTLDIVAIVVEILYNHMNLKVVGFHVSAM